MNRKLIRPNLAQIKERALHASPMAGLAAPEAVLDHARPGGGPRHEPGGAPRRRPAPAELTNAEAFYYLKQMNSQTPMVVVLDDGREVRGHIEWYDRGCLKIHRTDGPNMLVFKHAVRFLYKQDEEHLGPATSGPNSAL